MCLLFCPSPFSSPPTPSSSSSSSSSSSFLLLSSCFSLAVDVVSRVLDAPSALLRLSSSSFARVHPQSSTPGLLTGPIEFFCSGRPEPPPPSMPLPCLWRSASPSRRKLPQPSGTAAAPLLAFPAREPGLAGAARRSPQRAPALEELAPCAFLIGSLSTTRRRRRHPYRRHRYRRPRRHRYRRRRRRRYRATLRCSNPLAPRVSGIPRRAARYSLDQAAAVDIVYHRHSDGHIHDQCHDWHCADAGGKQWKQWC